MKPPQLPEEPAPEVLLLEPLVASVTVGLDPPRRGLLGCIGGLIEGRFGGRIASATSPSCE